MRERVASTSQLLESTITAIDDGPVLLISDAARLRESGASRAVRLSGSEVAGTWSDGLPRASLAVVDGAAAFPNEAVAVQLVHRLRDLHAERVLVIGAIDGGGHLTRHTLIGLGFRRWAISEDPDGRRRWYEFDLADYKVTPDWLNPRNWANPELWDKYRW